MRKTRHFPTASYQVKNKQYECIYDGQSKKEPCFLFIKFESPLVQNRLDWKCNTKAVYTNGQNILCFLRKRSFHVCTTMLLIFYKSLVERVVCTDEHIRVNVGFSVLLKDTSTCDHMGEARGLTPPTLQLAENSHLTPIHQISLTLQYECECVGQIKNTVLCSTP